jgi:hypothetical protein
MTYWELQEQPIAPADAEACWATGAAKARRFVLHRHRDAAGPHLDLRLEQEGYLLGYRIEGDTLDAAPWATEKAPHPVRWLVQDGDALREDAGLYLWTTRDDDGGALLLRTDRGFRHVTVQRRDAFSARCARALHDALRTLRCTEDDLAALAGDGAQARSRAIARFCGLGHELDGAAFDESVWRRSLAGLTLDEIHQHLRAYEVRFDAKYPPQPVSQPEPLPVEHTGEGAARALAILNP